MNRRPKTSSPNLADESHRPVEGSAAETEKVSIGEHQVGDLDRHVPQPGPDGDAGADATCQSDYPEGVVDHGRPLAPRGRREASLAGGGCARMSRPSMPCCAPRPPARARPWRAPVSTPPRLSRPPLRRLTGEMIAEINRVADEAATLLVVGHEPTVSQVALGLAARPAATPTRWIDQAEVPDVRYRGAAGAGQLGRTRTRRSGVDYVPRAALRTPTRGRRPGSGTLCPDAPPARRAENSAAPRDRRGVIRNWSPASIPSA